MSNKYIISEYTKRKAVELGVEVKPSKNKLKKIDIYKDNKFLFSIGAMGYFDYPTYIKKFNKRYADNRRRLYRIRHAKNIGIRDSAGWYASKLLW
jgi:hypothetical protein